MLYRFPDRQEVTQHVDIELLMESLLGQVSDHLEYRDASVVHEHVYLAVIGLYPVEQANNVGRIAHVSLHSDCPPTSCLDRRDDGSGSSRQLIF